LSSFLVVALPLVVFLMINPGSDGRVNQLNYLQNSSLSVPQKVSYFSTNIVKTVSMFFYRGDANGRHNFPYKAALNPLLGLLFISGIVLVLKNIRNKQDYGSYFALYFLIALIPALLTIPSENPHMLRTYTVVPAIVFAIGSILVFLQKIKYGKIISLVIVAIIGVGCIYELRTYFIYQSRVMRNSLEVVCPIEKVVYRNTKNLGDLPMECRIQKNLF